MSRTTNQSQIHGVANIVWTLSTVTPLCIKSGTTSVWKQAGGNAVKTRLVNAEFDFFKKQKDGDNESDISDFYFDSYIDGNIPKIRYRIPATSVRGAIRNYTIRRLIPKEYWRAALDATGEEDGDNPQPDANDAKLVMALKQPGWHIVQNLFGLSMDRESDDLSDESVSGRIMLLVDDLKLQEENEFKTGLIAGTWGSNVKLGSTHGKMVITTRNPLGRVTQGAKDKGLHTFMELAPGNEFKVRIKICNPDYSDLGLIAFWEKSINNGLLRIGGLSSVGRGRLTLKKTIVNLYLKHPEMFAEIGLEKAAPPKKEDILSDVFQKYKIPEWAGAARCCMKHLNNLYQNIKET